MMICCPMTSKIKGYPFEVIVSQQPPSAVLSDQIKSLDWRARQATFKGKVPAAVLVETHGKINALPEIK
jgi:mRNA interferase MazF